MKSAVLFLEEFQVGKKNNTNFSSHLEYLRTDHTPGFNWSKYWLDIKEKKLYKNLNSGQLDQLLSISEISCSSEHWVSFSELLLEIARTEKDQLLFTQKLRPLHMICSVYLPDKSIKTIVQFLSDRRGEYEAGKIQQKRSEWRDNSAINKDSTKEVAKAKKSTSETYIYTEELHTLLTDEWVNTKNTRSWDDILNLVDRPFWSDVRWIGYQREDKSILDRTLDIELSIYGSIEYLDQDILFMFEKTDKMQDILDLAGYEKYFSVPEILPWSLFWKNMRNRYPTKPANKNTKTLLSLYKFSCAEQDLASYRDLISAWKVTQYREFSVEYCVNKRLARSLERNSESGTERGIRRVLVGTQVPSDLAYETLELLFKNNPNHPKNIETLGAVLSVYEKDKYSRNLNEWKNLLNYFSTADWLYLMDILRERNDRKSIESVLDMHSQVNGGQNIPFLAEDLVRISKENQISLSEVSSRYGYRTAYLNSPDLLQQFWEEKIRAHTSKKSQSVDFRTLYHSKKCNYQFIENLYQMFYQHSKESILVSDFKFNSCLNFLNELAEKNWDKLRKGKGRNGSMKPAAAFWQAQMFSAYLADAGNPDILVKGISKDYWTQMLSVMMIHLKNSRDPKSDHALIQDIIKRVKPMYPRVPYYAMRKFLKQKNIHLNLHEYRSALVVNLIKSTSWTHFRKTHARDTMAISLEKMNTLLFVLTDQRIENINLKNLYDDKKVISALETVDKTINILPSEENGVINDIVNYTNFKLLDAEEVEYNSDFASINSNSFGFYLSALVINTLQPVIDRDKNLVINLINTHLASIPEDNSVQYFYKKWMEELIESIQNSRKINRSKVHSLKVRLNLYEK